MNIKPKILQIGGKISKVWDKNGPGLARKAKNMPKGTVLKHIVHSD